MDPSRAVRIQELFHEVVDLTPAGRAASLDPPCGVDRELRRDVESLVAAYEQVTTALGPLDRDDADPAREAAGPPAHSRYRIVRELGRGGMGVVYLAHAGRPGEHRGVAARAPRSVGDGADP